MAAHHANHLYVQGGWGIEEALATALAPLYAEHPTDLAHLADPTAEERTRDHQPLRPIGGDLHGLVLAFDSAYGPALEETRESVGRWLVAQGAALVTWVAVCPDQGPYVAGQWGPSDVG